MDRDTTPYANNVFEQPWWLQAVTGGNWKEILVHDKNTIIARLPVCYSKSKKSITMPLLTQTCGIWMKMNLDGSLNEKNKQVKMIIDKILDQIPPSMSIKIALDTSLQYFLPFYWKGFSIIPKVSYRIEDLTNLDIVFRNFSQNIKRDIKSAEKKLYIKEDISVEILMDIMKKTFEAQNRHYPIPFHIVESIVKESQRNNAGKMFYALDAEENIHACAYFVYDKNVFYYLIGGKDSKYKNSNAQTLILWKAIQYASTVSSIFDFEGSMVEGIETYFKRFGGRPVVYYEVHRQSLIRDIKDVCKPRFKRFLGYK